jgi:hypothetical protein
MRRHRAHHRLPVDAPAADPLAVAADVPVVFWQ